MCFTNPATVHNPVSVAALSLAELKAVTSATQLLILPFLPSMYLQQDHNFVMYVVYSHLRVVQNKICCESTNCCVIFMYYPRVSVSRAIRPFGNPGRPDDWFSQKVCLTVFVIFMPSLAINC